MIRLKTMSWAHAFSYGSDNSIDFTNPLVQLVGKNGHGKSSIALILEEVLYNKNSKGIKKANVLNRYSSAKQYYIALDFSKDDIEYRIETVRGTSQTVKLLENGLDISAHTSTATYKLIEEILGFDHKTFCQIVYQSNAFSLEFLTATDTNRKKFLIDFLDLSAYTLIAERIKAAIKELTAEADTIILQLKHIDNWLSKLNAADLVKKQRKEVPLPATTETLLLAEVQESLRTIESTNKRIVQNNKYKEILAGLDIEILPAPKDDIVSIKVSLNETKNKIVRFVKVITSTGPIISKCPACGQLVDSSHKEQMILEAKESLNKLELEAVVLEKSLATAEAEKRRFDASVLKLQEVEKYSSLIDKELSSVTLDKDDLQAIERELSIVIKTVTLSIDKLTKENQLIDTHNSKADVLLQQQIDMLADSKKLKSNFEPIAVRLNNLQVLAKTFSPSGLIAYKIESMVKDLESLTNKYLSEMSGGRFQLSFVINTSDKLDVVITDNGTDIDIYALSNGELSRVNISTLLAIRRIMQSLSKTRINLLILDETVESLDVEGKEKLIEVLLKEEHLNTIIVSHGFSHPLLTKIEVIKERNISRIEQ